MAELKSFNKCTTKDFKKLYGDVGEILNFFGDIPQIKNLEDISQLFSSVKFKDEEGVWHELRYASNYEIIFGWKGITLKPFSWLEKCVSKEGVWPPVSKKLHFKEEYFIKNLFSPGLSDVGTFIKIPKGVTEYIFYDDEDED